MEQEKKTSSLKQVLLKMRMLPLFWSNLLLMLCIVVLMAAVLLLSNRLYDKSLANRYLSDTQAMLEYNCEALAEEIYMTYAIPAAMEGTSSYNYIRAITDGKLPERYACLLPFISKSLRNQQFLLQNNEECLIYLTGSHSICTRYRSFSVADDCFAQYLKFSETDSSEILEYLSDKNVVKLLKMQDVCVDGGNKSRQMALIIRPIGARISVMTLYSEETIIERLGVNYLPENTFVRISDNDGNLLEEYPCPIDSDIEKNSFQIQASLPYLRAKVTMWIPQSYLSQQTALARKMGWLMFALMIGMGLIFCVCFSTISAKPIQNLFRNYVDTSERTRHSIRGVNEVSALASILENTGSRIEALQRNLVSHLFVRVSSGAVLSEEDEQSLEVGLQGISPPFRIAVLHAGSAEELLHLSQLLSSGELPQCYAAALNMQELGVLMMDTPEMLEQIRQLCWLNPTAYCGVSTPFSSVERMHEAVRQARVCLPSSGGFAIYSGSAVAGPFTWLQHERLYQSVMSLQRENCLQMIQMIGDSQQHQHAGEAFYTVRYILRSAAAELDLPLPEVLNLEYKEAMLPRENMERLKDAAEILFKRFQQRKQHSQNNDNERVLAWLEENFADCNLNTAMIAEQFSLSEKSIYNIVKQATGKGVQEYILSLRMGQVARQICSTQDGILEIAQRCGYPSASTFYRVFKKYFGVTPLQYRENNTYS